MLEKTQQIILDYTEGKTGLLESTLELRELREKAEQIIKLSKQFEYDFLEEFDQFKGESHYGFEFLVVNGRKTYDFSKCTSVVEAKNKAKQEEEKAKAALDLYLKTGQKPISEDGEIMEFPEIKYGASYLRVSKTKN